MSYLAQHISNHNVQIIDIHLGKYENTQLCLYNSTKRKDKYLADFTL